MLIYEVLQKAKSRLEQNDCEVQVAEWLLLYHLAMDRSQLFMHYRKPMPKTKYEAFWKDLTKHIDTHMPVQHLIGTSEFYGRSFQVNEHTLIPRPETEEVVLEALQLAKQQLEQTEQLVIIDVGTGSGIIAITLALELGNRVDVYATDISEEALQVAEENNRIHDAQVTFLQGDLLQPIMNRKFHPQLIVSNPPYIAHSERDDLSPVVLNHDPHLALFAEDKGLYFYKKMIQQIKQAGWHEQANIILEIGAEQGMILTDYLKEQLPNKTITLQQDINKNDRILSVS